MKAPVNKTCLIGPAIKPEQFIPEHLFFYLIEGGMSGYSGDKSYNLNAGGYGIVRKNTLGRQTHVKGTGYAEKVIFVFDADFLKQYQQRYKPPFLKLHTTEAFLSLPDNNLIPKFIESLTPYYNEQGQIDKMFFDLKREELLTILLHLRPELSGAFFDFGIPQKINLEEFMNRNYRFNVSLERFAFMTGRSLSTFKRDFKIMFNQTPNRWLLHKRLQEAYFLIVQNNNKSSDIYLDLGFEALSHFSYAFKKKFGLTPTELGQKYNSEL